MVSKVAVLSLTLFVLVAIVQSNSTSSTSTTRPPIKRYWTHAHKVRVATPIPKTTTGKPTMTPTKDHVHEPHNAEKKEAPVQHPDISRKELYDELELVRLERLVTLVVLSVALTLIVANTFALFWYNWVQQADPDRNFPHAPPSYRAAQKSFAQQTAG